MLIGILAIGGAVGFGYASVRRARAALQERIGDLHGANLVATGRGSRRARRQLEQAQVADLPLAIDVMQFALQTGSTVIDACCKVAMWGPPAWRPGFRAVGRAFDHGASFDEAFDHATHGYPELGQWRDVLLASARSGAPVVSLFAALATAARAEARAAAEARARRIPVQLLFPLVGCVLPAFVCLAIAPVLLGAFARFSH